MKYLLGAPGLAERAQPASPGVSRRQRLYGVRSGLSFRACSVSLIEVAPAKAGTLAASEPAVNDGGASLSAQDLVVVLAQLRRAAGDAPRAGGELVGRAGVAELAAQVLVRHGGLEAAGAEVLVFEGFLGRVDHAHGDAQPLEADEEVVGADVLGDQGQ